MDEILVRRVIGLEDLEEIRERVSEWASSCGLDSDRIYDLMLAVTELVTNSIEHGYNELSGFIEIEMSSIDQQLVIFIRDRASAFNPLTLPEPDLSLPLEKRSYGGLGIFLTRKMVDGIEYQRLPAGVNQIKIIMNLPHETKKDKGG